MVLSIGYFRDRIRYETANKEAKKVREVENWVWAESEQAEGAMVLAVALDRGTDMAKKW